MAEQDDQKPDIVVADTNYEVGQDNIRPFGLDIHNPVFMISAVGTVFFTALAMFFSDIANEILGNTRDFL